MRRNTKCVSIAPDGTQTIFVPKKKEPRTTAKMIDGKWVLVRKAK